MLRFQPTVFAVAAATFLVTGSADAASLFFQAVPRLSTASCQPDCYQLRIFYEDATRSLDIMSLELGMDLEGLTPLGFPPGGGNMDARANTTLEDAEGNELGFFPWQVNRVSNERPGFEAFLYTGGAFLFDVNSMQATHDAFNKVCNSTCALQREGLAANRILLGQFDVRWTGSGVGVRVFVNGPAGQPAVDDPAEGLARLDRTVFGVTGVPEPRTLVLLGIGLIGLTLRRTWLD